MDVIQASLNYLVRFSLVSIAWVAWLTPWPVSYLIATFVGAFGLLTRGSVVRANVAHVRAGDPPRRLVAWYLALQQIATHWKMLSDLLRASAAW